ncbi:hypothetical protein HK102_013144, partial [Quaeritorhiza haematococci]
MVKIDEGRLYLCVPMDDSGVNNQDPKKRTDRKRRQRPDRKKTRAKRRKNKKSQQTRHQRTSTDTVATPVDTTVASTSASASAPASASDSPATKQHSFVSARGLLAYSRKYKTQIGTFLIHLDDDGYIRICRSGLPEKGGKKEYAKSTIDLQDNGIPTKYADYAD